MTMREQRDDRDQWLDHLGALALPGSAGAGPCMEPASILGGKFVRPHLRAVEHAQDANNIGVDQIGRDIGRARNDQLARAIDAPGPAAVRKWSRRRAASAICSST